jgi:threonine aldolase
MIDLRSDTVTLPPPEMMDCVYRAELGDDLYGEDPTVNELQELAARITGKEAALLTPSGTMSNILAFMTHCRHGDEVVIGEGHFAVIFQLGGPAAIAGVSFRILPLNEKASYDIDRLEQVIRTADLFEPPTGLIWTENSFAGDGGIVLPQSELEKISAVAKKHGLPVFLDGARIFNAAVYQGIEVKEICEYADTVAFCLSKGLSAPLGSVLCGPADFIAEARRNRQKLGGGQRQAGIIAAAGIYAIEKMSLRLQEDHENARTLAEGIAEIPGLFVDLSSVQTNIVVVELTSERMTQEEVVAGLEERGVLVVPWTKGRIRLVTHYGVERSHIEQALQIIGDVIKE